MVRMSANGVYPSNLIRVGMESDENALLSLLPPLHLRGRSAAGDFRTLFGGMERIHNGFCNPLRFLFPTAEGGVKWSFVPEDQCAGAISVACSAQLGAPMFAVPPIISQPSRLLSKSLFANTMPPLTPAAMETSFLDGAATSAHCVHDSERMQGITIARGCTLLLGPAIFFSATAGQLDKSDRQRPLQQKHLTNESSKELLVGPGQI